MTQTVRTMGNVSTQKLGEEADNMRLMEVCPGALNYSIQLRVLNTCATECSEPERSLSLHQIQLMFSKERRDGESCKGEFMFNQFGQSRQPPDPDESVERWKYMLPEDVDDDEGNTPIMHHRLNYDALYYTLGS